MNRRLATVASLLLLVACQGDPPEPPKPSQGKQTPDEVTARPTAVVRLWRDLVPVESSSRPLSQESGEAWFEGAFDGSHLFHGARETREGVFSFEPFRPRGGQIRLTTSLARAMAYGGAVHGGEAMSVRLRVAPGRPTAIASEGAVAVVVELSEAFDPDSTMTRDDVLELLDPRRRASHVLNALMAEDPVEVGLEFVTDPSTHSIVIYLLSPQNDASQAHIFDSLSVRSLGLADYVAAGGEVRRVERLKGAAVPEAVTVELDRELRQALSAVPPASYAWDLLSGEGTRWLDLSLGVMPRDGSLEGAVRFRVEADGVELLSEERRAPRSVLDPSWADRKLELPAGTRRLLLSTEAIGADPPLAYLGHPTVLSRGLDERPHVVLISLDTLRPDRLGSYGAEPSWSPHLDGLAAEGIRYIDAYSTSSYTLPSHGSMLTGQYPAFHGAVDVTDSLDPSRSPMLAEMLAREGWVTAGFTGGGFVSADYGFSTGFDRYSHNDPVWATGTIRGEQLIETMSFERMPIRGELLDRYDVRAVEQWIGDHGDGPPFFLFLHTYIAHNYAPTEDWMERLDLIGNDADPAFQKPFNHKQRAAFNAGEESLRGLVYDQYMPYYDATVGMADDFVGRVLGALEEAGVSDRTMVVVTSDHGEEFGEQGYFGHGLSLTEEVTRVPLIARLPADQRGPAGQVETERLSLVDVSPWILDTVGLEPDPRMAVTPPLGPERASPPGRSSLVMELDNHRLRLSALRDDQWKLVVELARDGEALSEERLRLFDLDTGGEQRDEAEQRPEQVARLRAILASFHKLAQAVRPRGGGPVDLDALDPELRQQLEALGYLGGADDEQ